MSLFPLRRQWSHALRELLDRQTAARNRHAREGFTILIVDDDEDIRLIVEYSVQQMGYRTFTAANAEEALSLVEHSRPDIVLTDALMPKVDGRQLCRLIKAADVSIKAIVLSSLSKSAAYIREALHVFQADAFLAKPIDFDEMRRLLDEMSRRAA